MKASLFFLSLVSTLLFSCTKDCVCDDPPETKTLESQPGPNEGQDALVYYRINDLSNIYGGANWNHIAEVHYSQWTYTADGHPEGTVRTYLKFPATSAIATNATILSARLSLYGVSTSQFLPQGNTSTAGATNHGWITRVTGNWDESTITWLNKPGITETNRIEIPPSTSQWNSDATQIDVTNLVKDIVASGQNNGFCIYLQTEQVYRSRIFANSEYADASKRPKLVIQYQQ